MRSSWIAIAALAACTAAQEPREDTGDARFTAARADMIATLEAHARASRGAPGMPDAFSPDVLDAMRATPRHEFVPADARELAYFDSALDIGEGQTISQPFIVALMTEVSGAGPDSNVLEIGTGSGYQAAVLAELGANVHTIEIVPELGERAAATLGRLGYDIEARIGDGYLGWPEAAPFDAILVTAAAPYVPEPLIEQLAPGGRMVIPVGPERAAQELQLIEKDTDGAVTTTRLTGVRFVPLTRAQ